MFICIIPCCKVLRVKNEVPERRGRDADKRELVKTQENNNACGIVLLLWVGPMDVGA